jgi:CHAT domain-containing protein
LALAFSLPTYAQSDVISEGEELLNQGEFEQALGVLQETNTRTARLYTGQAWAGLDSLTQALRLYESVTTNESGEEIADSLSMAAFGRSAFILRRRLGKGAEGLAARQRAVEIGLKWAPDKDGVLTELYYRLGNAAFFLNEFPIARRALRLTDYYADRMPAADTTAWIDALRLLGNIIADDYDSDLIRSVTRKSTRLFEQQKYRPNRLLGREIYLDGADARDRIGDRETAVEFIDKGLAMAESMNDSYGMIRSLNLAATMYEKVGRYEEVTQFYKRAISIYNDAEEKPGDISFIYANLARRNHAEGEYKIASENFIKSIELTSDDRLEEFLPSRKTDYGRTLAMMGDTSGAMAMFNGAVELISRGNTYQKDGAIYAELDSVYFIRELISLYESRAEGLIELGLEEKALDNYDKLFEVQDLQRRRQISDGSLRFTSDYYHGAHQAAIETCYLLYNRTGLEDYLWRALAYGERAKAYGLRAALQREDVDIGSEEKQLRSLIATLDREVLSNPNAFPRLDSATLALRNLIAQDSAKVILGLPDWKLLRSDVMSAGEDVLSYHLGDAVSFLFYLKPSGSITAYELPPVKTIGEMVEKWRQAIIKGAYRSKSLLPTTEQQLHDDVYVKLGLELREMLLPANLGAEASLRLLPDGPLNYLPFAALPLRKPEGTSIDYRTMDYLASAHTLSYAYSLDFQRSLRYRDNGDYAYNLLAFAPSFQGESAPLAIRGVRGGKGLSGGGDHLPGLRPLKYNEEEVSTICGLVPKSRQFIGGEAGKSNFMKWSGSGQILHLSTHGVVDRDQPDLSFVAFSQPDNTTRLNDLLFFNELTTLPLDAELVVLAACETSLGQIARGESILSMASAFTAAGARSTLTSLWQVDDEATNSLMDEFYAGLSSGESRAGALISAQEILKVSGEGYAHPYFWSGMVLHGNTAPIAFKASSRWWLYSVGALGVLLLAGLALRRRRAA